MADEKKKRSYELRVSILDALESFAEAGTSRQRAIEAGIRLLEHAPLHLRDLALRGDGSSVRAWFHRAEELIAKDTVLAAVDREARKARPAGRKRAKGGKAKSA